MFYRSGRLDLVGLGRWWRTVTKNESLTVKSLKTFYAVFKSLLFFIKYGFQFSLLIWSIFIFTGHHITITIIYFSIFHLLWEVPLRFSITFSFFLKLFFMLTTSMVSTLSRIMNQGLESRTSEIVTRLSSCFLHTISFFRILASVDQVHTVLK